MCASSVPLYGQAPPPPGFNVSVDSARVNVIFSITIFVSVDSKEFIANCHGVGFVQAPIRRMAFPGSKAKNASRVLALRATRYTIISVYRTR